MTGGYGLYGVRLSGIGPSGSLGEVPPSYPEWTISVTAKRDEPDAKDRFLEGAEWGFEFGDGGLARVSQRGKGGALSLALPRPVPDRELGHPYLSVIGLVASLWGGGIAMHAGVFEAHGSAWIVAAAKGGGKSTTLALLAMAGQAVLADDLAVMNDQLVVHRGPRFIDLRREVSDALGLGDAIGMLGARERWRYRIGSAPLSLPLGGIIVPGWGEESIHRLDTRERLGLVAATLPITYPNDRNRLILDLANTVPVLRWNRKHDLSGASDAVQRMLAAIATT